MGAWFTKKRDESIASSQAARERMVRNQLQSRGIRDQGVLSAMLRVERERFVPPTVRDQAHDDAALAIGLGQTISQPYMVAVMSQELELIGGERVLEIGTGSGYQTAILAELVGGPTGPAEAKRERRGGPSAGLRPPKQALGLRSRSGDFGEGGSAAQAGNGHVYTIERLAELSESAQRTLSQLGYRNISFRVGDGSQGWEEAAPFDAVLVTAGAPSIPAPLIEQLADGGRFVGPVGPGDVQTLVKWTRKTDGEIVKQNLLECRFVRLIGSAGWDS